MERIPGVSIVLSLIRRVYGSVVWLWGWIPWARSAAVDKKKIHSEPGDKVIDVFPDGKEGRGQLERKEPQSPESSDWQLKKEQYLSMSFEEKRAQAHRDYQNTLADVGTWFQYCAENVHWLTSLSRGAPGVSSQYPIKVKLNEKVAIWRGDITTLEVDAIVNAANGTLLGGGGVDGAIHRAAGLYLRDECATLNGCETGDAKITGAYCLPAKHVIHTVGPIGEGAVDLQFCYSRCLDLMRDNGLRSIAFPCISTGIYGFPNEPAAHIALETARGFVENYASEVDRIVFCLFLAVDVEIYERLMQQYFPVEEIRYLKPQGSDGLGSGSISPIGSQEDMLEKVSDDVQEELISATNVPEDAEALANVSQDDESRKPDEGHDEHLGVVDTPPPTPEKPTREDASQDNEHDEMRETQTLAESTPVNAEFQPDEVCSETVPEQSSPHDAFGGNDSQHSSVLNDKEPSIPAEGFEINEPDVECDQEPEKPVVQEDISVAPIQPEVAPGTETPHCDEEVVGVAAYPPTEDDDYLPEQVEYNDENKQRLDSNDAEDITLDTVAEIHQSEGGKPQKDESQNNNVSAEDEEPAKSAWDTGSEPTKSAWDTGSEPTKSAWDTGSEPTKSAWDTGSEPTKSAWDTESEPTENAWDTGSEPTKSAWDTGSEPTEKASEPTEKASEPTEKASEPTDETTPALDGEKTAENDGARIEHVESEPTINTVDTETESSGQWFADKLPEIAADQMPSDDTSQTPVSDSQETDSRNGLQGEAESKTGVDHLYSVPPTTEANTGEDSPHDKGDSDRKNGFQSDL